MEDDQSGSLWSQISGLCLRGKYEGRELTMFASSFSTFGEMKSRPAVLFLEKPEKGKAQSHYKGYFEDRSRIGIFGTVATDNLMDAKDKIYGLRTENAQLALPVTAFADQSAQLVNLDGKYILVISDGKSEVAAFEIPTIGDKKLSLKYSGESIILSEAGGGSALFTFVGLEQASGEAVEPFPVVTAFWFAWKAFFPMSDIY